VRYECVNIIHDNEQDRLSVLTIICRVKNATAVVVHYADVAASDV